MERELVKAERKLTEAREQLNRLSLAYRERRRELKRARALEESSLEQEIALLSLGRDVRLQQIAVGRAEKRYREILGAMRRTDAPNA